mmetsp:Transcript_2627/g.6536  ORF Transcript_2627/g.6536 Transcript_2627/m.6536 type:complete len:93 (-) Transcript_2627:666-944(-)
MSTARMWHLLTCGSYQLAPWPTRFSSLALAPGALPWCSLAMMYQQNKFHRQQHRSRRSFVHRRSGGLGSLLGLDFQLRRDELVHAVGLVAHP